MSQSELMCYGCFKHPNNPVAAKISIRFGFAFVGKVPVQGGSRDELRTCKHKALFLMDMSEETRRHGKFPTPIEKNAWLPGDAFVAIVSPALPCWEGYARR